MKKVLNVLLMAVVVMAFASPGYAAGWEKLKGGGTTILKSPLQIKDNVVAEYDAAEFKPFGVLGGLGKGFFYMGKDIVTGLFDVLTFPVDIGGGE